jgi:integrase
MLRTKRLDDDGVLKLKAKKTRYAVPDPELRGHYVRITPTGAKSFWVVARDPTGKQHWRPVGSPGQMTIGLARTEAAKIIRTVRGATPNSFAAIAQQWRALHCSRLRKRTVIQYDRSVKRMNAEWSERDFTSIERDDITRLMDAVEVNSGTREANHLMQTFSSIANWYATRSRHYRSPIVKGMWRGKRVKRDRILTDDELRAVWQQAEANGVYGALIRMALLTAQRQGKLATVKWSDLDGSVWTIATEEGEKGNAGVLILEGAAMAIISEQPKTGPYVFQFSNNWDRAKKAFDAKVKIAPWRFHDLRRTARSLLSRAGVRPDIAERVMGHVQGGVLGTYDRHEYKLEKADALKRLAQQIMDIVVPPPSNVQKLRA